MSSFLISKNNGLWDEFLKTAGTGFLSFFPKKGNAPALCACSSEL
jgi:hypothetical protein